MSSKVLAERYHVSRAWVDALKQRKRETGSFAPRPQAKFRARVLAGQDERLKALVTAQPDATLAELRDALKTSAGLATIWRALNHLTRVLPGGTRAGRVDMEMDGTRRNHQVEKQPARHGAHDRWPLPRMVRRVSWQLRPAAVAASEPLDRADVSPLPRRPRS